MPRQVALYIPGGGQMYRWRPKRRITAAQLLQLAQLAQNMEAAAVGFESMQRRGIVAYISTPPVRHP